MTLVRRAWDALTHHRGRTLLAILGVAVSAAMLLDMVMLSSGMRASFRNLLLSKGFQLRISPKGTLPFDTDATIPDANALIARLRAVPGVTTISPVLGGQLQVTTHGRTITAVTLGVDPAVQGDFDVVAGRAPIGPNELAASDDFLAAAHVKLGDTVSVAGGFDTQLRDLTRQRIMTIVARAHFLYMPAGQRAIAVPLATLQTMEGPAGQDRVSLMMIKARQGAAVDSVLHRIEAAVPSVSAVSTETALQQVDARLSYFRQLSLILGGVSLAVGFLLVTTLVTVSVNERLGEIVILRAIGVVRQRVVVQIVLESVAIMFVGAIAGLALGLVTAHYLNSILASFPGLPAAIDFFYFEPKDAWAALGMLVGAGIIAGIYPAWRGASLPIAATLREEAA